MVRPGSNLRGLLGDGRVGLLGLLVGEDLLGRLARVAAAGTGRSRTSRTESGSWTSTEARRCARSEPRGHARGGGLDDAADLVVDLACAQRAELARRPRQEPGAAARPRSSCSARSRPAPRTTSTRRPTRPSAWSPAGACPRSSGRARSGATRRQPFLGRDFGHEADYSEEIAREIDDEIRRIVEHAHERAREVLTAHIDELQSDVEDPDPVRDVRRRPVPAAALGRGARRGLRRPGN